MVFGAAREKERVHAIEVGELRGGGAGGFEGGECFAILLRVLAGLAEGEASGRFDASGVVGAEVLAASKRGSSDLPGSTNRRPESPSRACPGASRKDEDGTLRSLPSSLPASGQAGQAE